MELEDRITVATPEGIELQLVLAGAGSRFIAGTIDLVIQLAADRTRRAGRAWSDRGRLRRRAASRWRCSRSLFLYDIVFEVLASGRTPGKRVTHLRVVRDKGEPVDLPASAIRNLLRLIDLLPSVYLVGLLSILITQAQPAPGRPGGGHARDPRAARSRRRRRRERRRGGQGERIPIAPSAPAVAHERLGRERDQRPGDRRRAPLPGAAREPRQRARRELAHRLEQGLRTKVAGAPAALEPETFLEALAQAKATR